ncbi:MAG: ParB family chromosome partitioning protein [Planctomycetota bacterium]|jgi:ParB family chromosome partitioning protein
MVDRRLGRGLDFFLSGGRKPANPPATTPLRDKIAPDAGAPAEHEEGELVRMVPVADLQPNPYQPRKNMAAAELETLSQSIRESGILQPILARQVGDTLQIVAGERRWRAAQLAELTEVPVLCRTMSDSDSAVFALVENLQREDLNSIEKAQGIKLLMDQMKATQEQVAKQVGFERSTVANFLRLLDLPDAIQQHVSRGTLTMGHGRALLALPDHELMNQTADFAIKQRLSVRALEAKVKELLAVIAAGTTGDAPPTPKAKKARPVWLNELEESLVEALSTPVAIKYGRKRSQIVIDCGSQEELDRIFTRLKNA